MIYATSVMGVVTRTGRLNTQSSLTYYSMWDLALTLFDSPRAASLSHKALVMVLTGTGQGQGHLTPSFGMQLTIRVALIHGRLSKWKGQALVAGKQGPMVFHFIGAPVPVPRDFAVTWQGVSRPLFFGTMEKAILHI
jgi:hypothetical protein